MDLAVAEMLVKQIHLVQMVFLLQVVAAVVPIITQVLISLDMVVLVSSLSLILLDKYPENCYNSK